MISPYITGGKRIAAAALRPQVLDFVDGILTGDTVLAPGDTLICMGTDEQLRSLNKILGPINSYNLRKPKSS